MKLISKLKIKTSSQNIKELYIGFAQDNILDKINLVKIDNIWQAKLYFNYKHNFSIYLKIIPIDDGIKHDRGFNMDNEMIEFKTNSLELGDYRATYNLEIIEKKYPVDEWYFDDYNYEYEIKM
jgi:hypothetical protein